MGVEVVEALTAGILGHPYCPPLPPPSASCSYGDVVLPCPPLLPSRPPPIVDVVACQSPSNTKTLTMTNATTMWTKIMMIITVIIMMMIATMDTALELTMMLRVEGEEEEGERE